MILNLFDSRHIPPLFRVILETCSTLHLETCGGWKIIREEVSNVLMGMDLSDSGNQLYQYMTREYMDQMLF